MEGEKVLGVAERRNTQDVDGWEGTVVWVIYFYGCWLRILFFFGGLLGGVERGGGELICIKCLYVLGQGGESFVYQGGTVFDFSLLLIFGKNNMVLRIFLIQVVIY